MFSLFLSAGAIALSAVAVITSFWARRRLMRAAERYEHAMERAWAGTVLADLHLESVKQLELLLDDVEKRLDDEWGDPRKEPENWTREDLRPLIRTRWPHLAMAGQDCKRKKR